MTVSLRRWLRLLLPTPRFPVDDNGHTLRYCWRNGDRLELPRPVDFSILFPDESSARAAVSPVTAIADRVAVKFNTEEGKWDMTATRSMALTHDGVTSYEHRLAATVAPFQGCLDGWGSFAQ
jgi:Regulator of ribonuclease activity B